MMEQDTYTQIGNVRRAKAIDGLKTYQGITVYYGI